MFFFSYKQWQTIGNIHMAPFPLGIIQRLESRLEISSVAAHIPERCLCSYLSSEIQNSPLKAGARLPPTGVASNLPVLCLGDVRDTWSASPEVISKSASLCNNHVHILLPVFIYFICKYKLTGIIYIYSRFQRSLHFTQMSRKEYICK